MLCQRLTCRWFRLATVALAVMSEIEDQLREIDKAMAVEEGDMDGAARSCCHWSARWCLGLAWIEIHQEDLLADWDLAVNGKKLFPIKGLDQ